MAKGWVEFWLVWIAVDVVGVPSLVRAELYPSAVLYGFYGLFCVVGFFTWLRAERTESSPQRQEAAA
jgi:nicotinamide mononucleotide transporter